jgi:hypothetical protein
MVCGARYSSQGAQWSPTFEGDGRRCAKIRYSVLIFAVIAPSRARAAADPPPKPAAVTDLAAPQTVHVVSGSKEYQSEASLKPFLADLEKQYRVTVTAEIHIRTGGTDFSQIINRKCPPEESVDNTSLATTSH